MEFSDLIHVIQSLNAPDAFKPRLTLAQWKSLEPYLIKREVLVSELLITQGEIDRTMYFIGRGSVSVFVNGAGDRSNRIAILREGSVVGEPCLFASEPRMANVEAIQDCVVWGLRSPRFAEMAPRLPLLALELMRAAGEVMAIRWRACMENRIPFA
jgi:CRP/FNR family cyclic AMP-dependent transcriptional regulator